MSIKDILEKLGLTFTDKEVSRPVRRVKRPSNKGFKNSRNSLELKRMMNQQYDKAPYKIQGKKMKMEDKDEDVFYEIPLTTLSSLFKNKE